MVLQAVLETLGAVLVEDQEDLAMDQAQARKTMSQRKKRKRELRSRAQRATKKKIILQKIVFLNTRREQ